ncbi:autotransporter outer membrane beta-barrel domain-containing protein [Pseudomonas sp. FBF18]|nr:autotransporter outer membrane beta-barrel domain-containing protein [Pseudomonas sp. FBF18]
MRTSTLIITPFKKIIAVTQWATALSMTLVSPQIFAVVLDNQTLTITSLDAPTDYQLVNQSLLIVDSAQTFGLRLNRSGLNILSGTVTATGRGIELADSQATIANASITSSSNFGLLLVHGSGVGSTATVTNSQITGATTGAQATAGSVLNLVDSNVTGTGPNAHGLRLLGAEANVTGSTITGQNAGVRMSREGAARPDAPVLRLNNSVVRGVNGPAIQVASNATAIIEVLNGSTLTAGNGVILDTAIGTTTDLTVASSSLEGDVATAGATTATFTQSTLNGNVNVSDTGSANLRFDQSRITGDVVAASGGTASVTLNNSSQLTGRLENVQQVNINNNSNWTLNADNTVANLAMNGGQVTFGDNATFYRLNVENLSGNGTFVMASDFSNGNTDFLNVTGNASGSHGLLMGSNGADPSLDSLKVVHMGSGDAQFSLLNQGEQVDLGAYSYKLVQKGDQDWYLDRETRTISPMTRTVMALFNTPITIAYGEMTSLRSRMGELRYNQGKNAGVWMRAYGNQHNIADASSGVGYQQNQRGLTFGADAQLGESNWTLGLLAGHSRSDLNLSYGSSGSIDSYYVGGYATWMDPESGYYVDSVLKYNRYQNDAKVGLSDGTRTKGDYDTHGISASVEVGKHIKLDDGYFIEPFAQVAAAAVAGKDFTLDNGFDANGDVSRSLLGKVGTTLGKTISLDGDSMIQPYVKAAFAHEFAQRNQVQVNNNVFNNDLSGSRAELGAGVAWTVAKDFQVYGEAGYMNGKNIEMPYSFSLGASYRF